ncbi:hypothetical protein DSCOOX_37990 [Desulfosarcina ovata subsp. ovata]|uniref:Bacterial transcriptional activator domain-containing protein n=2 Tax=Desulfosarcina ovata TaxID=83564 RepID=A0A5K8ADJ2_9BACT|nr:hypothetical protein DSCOOX_37990 [Desulfosarcina ovata subsp. ovata]
MLSAITTQKMGLIVAGAGYGKTTLAAQCIADLKVDGVWYGLEESDSDLATFLTYLVEGIRERHPGFAAGIEERWAESLLLSTRREMVLAELLAEVERWVTQTMVIVLDDYYLVDAHSSVHTVLEDLLHRSGPMLHFVVISRHEPPLKISRLRAMLEVVDIGEDDLTFHREEIARLYHDQLKTPLGDPEMAALYAATGGWAAGLILFYHAARGRSGGAPDGGLPAVGKTKDYIFKYFKENIFDRLAPELQRFMIQTALLDRLEPDLCDTLLNRRDSRTILDMLCREHLFTFKSTDENAPFRYHHLLQEFLRRQLETTRDRNAIATLHMDIGHAMEKNGDLFGAIRHYFAGRHFEAIGRLIKGMMMRDIMECPLAFLGMVLEKIPEALLSQEPRLIYLRAKLTSIQGNPHQAIDGLRKALVQFRGQKDESGVASCLKDLSYHYYITGNIRRARKEMAPLWGRPHDDPFFSMEVAGLLILFCAILGDMPAADDYHREAIRFSSRSGKTGRSLVENWLNLCYSYRFYCSGAFEKAYRINAKAMHGFRRDGMIGPLPLAYFQAALISFYRGRHRSGGAYADKGLRLARTVGFSDSTYAWLLYSRALNQVTRRNSAQSIDDAELALQIFTRHDNFWGQASIHEVIAMHHQARHAPDQAQAALRQGLTVIDGLDLPFTWAALTLRLAQVCMDQGDDARAHGWIDHPRSRFAVSDFHLFRLFRLKAQIAAGQRQPASAIDHMATALQIARANHYDPWVLKGGDRMISTLLACHAGGIMRSYIERLFAGADESLQAQLARQKNAAHRNQMVADARPAFSPQRWQAPLEIQCLGPFTVSCGERVIPDRDWRSANVRRLFQYLTLKSGQGFIPKDVLLELLWPGEDPQKTNRRFHVTMTALRKLLEPDLKRGVPSNYILRQNDGYRLEPGRKGTIDFIDFLNRCRQLQQSTDPAAPNRLDAMLHAASIYNGDLFQEEPYADWCVQDREAIQSRYRELLLAIIRTYEARSDWNACIPWAEKHLIIDRYAETVYRTLMRCHFHRGDRVRLEQVYHRCKANIAVDLNSPLSPQTTALYDRLSGAAGN